MKHLFAALVLISLLSACTQSGFSGAPRVGKTPDPAQELAMARVPRDVPVPPWQLWGADVVQPDIAAGEKYLKKGELELAALAFRDGVRNAVQPMIRDDAMLRLCGTLLKLGNSREVLEEISKYLNKQGNSAQDAKPAFSLLVAYAYLHQKDSDQALAWFGLAYKAGRGQGGYAQRSSAETIRFVRSMNDGMFQSYSQRWAVDSFAGPIFSRERLRRAQGGKPTINDSLAVWFKPSHYSPYVIHAKALGQDQKPEVETDLAREAALVPDLDKEIVIGVILPLSGRFAEHAQQVQEGIELAVGRYGGGQRLIRLEIVDSAGNEVLAEREYERLVKEKGAAFVLGPLLVKTTERVAKKSRELGVPFVTFTKREGVPSLGPSVFRLGATAGSQVRELVAYTVGELKQTSFSILYPETSSGREFVSIFRQEVARHGGQLLVQAAYYHGDRGSIEQAVRDLEQAPAQAIFIPDSLENAFPALELMQGTELAESLLLGPAQWNDPIAIRGYGQLIDGAVYVAPFYSGSQKPAVAEFVELYLDRFHHEPELLAAQAYDAACFAIEAVTAHGSSTRTLIERLNAADTLYGVTGRLDLGEDGEITRRMTVLRLHGGDIVEVMSAGIASGFVPNERKKTAKNIQG